MQSPDLHARVDNDFGFHPATTDITKARHEAARATCLRAAHDLIDLVPPGRELSTALTKLEEAMMHANAGIARATPLAAVEADLPQG